jgi:hypothetical protein
MEVRYYVIVLELSGTADGIPPVDLCHLEAFDVQEAAKQAYIESFGRYHCQDARIVFIRPATMRNVKFAIQLTRDMPLYRMPVVGLMH